MALARYETQIYLPGGDPAAGRLLSVWPRGSNQLALLFTDSSGLSPQTNPLLTDASGFLAYWAAPGDYVTWLAGQMLSLTLDPAFTSPVWPDLWTHTQTVPAAVWTVTHHFGVVPSVDVAVAGHVALCDVAHTDTQTTVLTFSDPVSGTAYLRR